MSFPIYVLLAGASDLYRTGFKEAIKHFPELHLAGGATTADQLLQLVPRLAPHIIVMEVEAPAMQSSETCKQLKAAHPHIGVIAFGIYSQPYVVRKVLCAGADGYLTRGVWLEEIKEAVIKVHCGGTFYCREITPTVQTFFKNKVAMLLTETEEAILKGICLEQTTKEIADDLCLSPHTVETYRKTILRKCGAKGTVGMVLHALRNGIVKL